MPDATVDEILTERLQLAVDHGQRLSPWVIGAMRFWLKRNVRPPAKGKALPRTYIELGIFPTICDCAKCKRPAIIYPPEGSELQGFCICPKCSLHQQVKRA